MAKDSLRGLNGLQIVGADVVEVAPEYDPAAVEAIGPSRGMPTQ